MRLSSIIIALLPTLALVACGKTATTTGSSTAASAGANATASTGGRTILLAWDARTGTAAEAFHIYGSPSTGAAETQIAVLSANTAGFNPANPMVTLRTTDATIAPYVGKTLCFTVSAVVGGIESGYSNVVCQPL